MYLDIVMNLINNCVDFKHTSHTDGTPFARTFALAAKIKL